MLKSPHSRRSATFNRYLNFAKRLDCGEFTAAFLFLNHANQTFAFNDFTDEPGLLFLRLDEF